MHVQIQKFIIVPVASIFSDSGDLIKEQQLPSTVHFTAAPLDIKDVALKLEESINDKIPKIEKADIGRRVGHRKNSGKV